jgi:hypothetical protein
MHAIRPRYCILGDWFVPNLLPNAYLYVNSDFPAFVVGSAIPQVQTITGIIAAAAIMQFTYTFPPLLWFGYQVRADAMIEDKAYSPGDGSKGRIDTWRHWSRWKRVKASA